MSISLAERIGGGLIGLLVGDALGVPYEFRPPDQIPAPDQIEFTPPAGFSAAHQGVPPGTWSDDGAQALCLLAALVEHRGLNLDDFSKKIVRWYQEGFCTPDGRVFDCGMQTHRAILALLEGRSPESSGPNGEQDNGNGSLMRVLPLALWHAGKDEDLVHHAHRQSVVTHGHERAQVCCALYCLWARELLEGSRDGWPEAAGKLERIYKGRETLRAELDFVLHPVHGERVHGGGYVLDCLWSARQVLQEPSYESVVRAAIRLGNDTDTTACVAGGLAGIRHGISSIPARWVKGLQGGAVYRPLLDALLQRGKSGTD